MIKPIGDRVLIEPIVENDIKKIGKIDLILPQTLGKEQAEQGKVIEVGEGRIDNNGKLIPLTVKKGDLVIFAKYSPNEIKVGDKKYLIAEEKDIFAIITK